MQLVSGVKVIFDMTQITLIRKGINKGKRLDVTCQSKNLIYIIECKNTLNVILLRQYTGNKKDYHH